jgi:ribosomal-protein-alanine N-acetyltransferase
VLATPRLRVTTWQPGDLADLCALHADPVTMRFMRSGVENESQVEARLDTYLLEQVEFGWTRWRLEDVSGAMIGRAGFRMADDQQHRELGYLLARSAWGSGLATELARALTQWHFDHPDDRLRPELFAHTLVDNVASQRVLGKAGFALEREAAGVAHFVATSAQWSA